MRKKMGSGVLRTAFAIGLAAVIAFSSLAWACTVQQRIYVIGHQTSSGAQLGVQGDWVTSSEPVYIRWNSQTGPVLAELPVAANGTFSTEVTIPDVSPGVYFLVATSGQFGIARAPIEVVSASAANPAQTVQPDRVSPDLWGGFESLTPGSGEIGAAQAPAPTSRPGAAGLALVGLGLVSLIAAGSVWVLRRGRASAG